MDVHGCGRYMEPSERKDRLSDETITDSPSPSRILRLPCTYAWPRVCPRGSGTLVFRIEDAAVVTGDSRKRGLRATGRLNPLPSRC